MKRTILTTIALVAITFMWNPAIAQKIKLQEGSLDALKNEKVLNVQYEYQNMGVGKFTDEADYVAKKTTEYNEKEAGRGDQWAKGWVADRKNRYEPNFEELFNKYNKFEIGNHPDAKYTLIFKTLFTEPGYNIYISRKNALIHGEAWIVETASPQNVIAKYSVKKSPGRTFGGYDFDTGLRIQEAYAAAGKALGKKMK